MFSGEIEVQAKRRTLSVLQDESRRVLDSARDLSLTYEAIVNNKPEPLKEALRRMDQSQNDAEALRRSLTRTLAEIGNMIMNREDLLRTAYYIEQIGAGVGGVAFRLSQLDSKVLAKKGVGDDIASLIDHVVEAVQKLNEIVRALSINPLSAIELANTVQEIERKVDKKHRAAISKILKEIHDIKDLMMLKDTIEKMEEVTDSCLHASDSTTILALGL